MKILIIGSGGREHALAWKLAQSSRVSQIYVAPGNGGTHRPEQNITNIPVPKTNLQGLIQHFVEFAVSQQIDLTVVGPEVPLANGIVDQFQAIGLKIWGPTQAAAQIESSKAFAKTFMERHNIPTGGYAAFTDFATAWDYAKQQTAPMVIKASGLAAGKGVILPESLQEIEQSLRYIMLEKQFGEAGDEVVIEERLSGPEVSVLAFCDGQTVKVMPPAQDHKRAFDNDEGPNTGGMGAYAPAPICSPELLNQIVTTVLQPTVDGLRAEGSPFVGILYAGIMLTKNGPKTLEFNGRFGDPETQILLPLLETDLLEIMEASLAGQLADLTITWKKAAAATVVLASEGYPGKYAVDKPIHGLEQAAQLDNVTLFHAGTRYQNEGQFVTSGGRVLNVTGTGATLHEALQHAYAGVKLIEFDGLYYRTDIGAKAK